MDGYLHTDQSLELISLHDCRAARVTLEDGVLSFWFPDGFWVLEGHPENPTGKTVRTDAARVDLLLRDPSGEEVEVSVFRNLRWPWSLRRKWELPMLMEAINEKRCQLEFGYIYPGGWRWIVEGWLWSDKRPWSRECQMHIDTARMRFHWNVLCPEKVW